MTSLVPPLLHPLARHPAAARWPAACPSAHRIRGTARAVATLFHCVHAPQPQCTVSGVVYLHTPPLEGVTTLDCVCMPAVQSRTLFPLSFCLLARPALMHNEEARGEANSFAQRCC